MENTVLGNMKGGVTIIVEALGAIWNTPKEASKDLSHISSLVAAAMDRYSASVEEHETVVCFLVFPATGDPPSVSKYPVSDRRVRGHAPQLASQ